jgi:uncharacterized protein (TIGR01244 family)
MNFRYLAAWACLLSFALVSISALAGEKAGPMIEKAELEGIYNYTRLEQSSGFAGQRVGFGGATEASAMPALKAEGYATVINLRQATEKGVDIEAARAAAEAVGVRYVHLPFNAADPEPGFVDAFLAAVGNEASQPVYVHCGSATRVAALWAIVRVQEDGWSLDEAVEETPEIAGKPESAIKFASEYLAVDSE